jgi:hypothetical protein
MAMPERTMSTRLSASRRPAGDQIVDGLGGQHDDVDRFSGMHPPGHIDTTGTLERDRTTGFRVVPASTSSASTSRVAIEDNQLDRFGRHGLLSPRPAGSGQPLLQKTGLTHRRIELVGIKPDTCIQTVGAVIARQHLQCQLAGLALARNLLDQLQHLLADPATPMAGHAPPGHAR